MKTPATLTAAALILWQLVPLFAAMRAPLVAGLIAALVAALGVAALCLTIAHTETRFKGDSE